MYDLFPFSFSIPISNVGSISITEILFNFTRGEAD